MERIPILRIGDTLLVSVQGELSDSRALALQADLTERVTQTRARGVLLDISAVHLVDSFIGRVITESAAMAQLLNAATVVVGMRPAVAITLVELGLSLPGVHTAQNVQTGLELLRRERKRRPPYRLRT